MGNETTWTESTLNTPNGTIILRAAECVDSRLDAGDAFERECRSSLEFHRAVEVARELRAYAPGKLRAQVLRLRVLFGVAS